MIPELGQFSLILALLLAALLGTLPLIGAQRRIGAWMALARPLAAGQFVFIVFAFLYFGVRPAWNHVAAFVCILAAVAFTFWPKE